MYMYNRKTRLYVLIFGEDLRLREGLDTAFYVLDGRISNTVQATDR
jgi:hypothetical protein